MPRIYFDVGANNGYCGIPELAHPDTIVYAFEPTPELCAIIKQRVGSNPNYILVEKAVSDFNGKATFNVAGQADWGCSSLLEFSDKSKTEWRGRDDFKVTQQIEVDVIRLEDFLIENNITFIDMFHCDTQGCDLKVLKGMGDKVRIIKRGVIEAANDKENILYYGQNQLSECKEFLEANGFRIDNVQINDGQGLDGTTNEVNIYFSRID